MPETNGQGQSPMEAPQGARPIPPGLAKDTLYISFGQSTEVEVSKRKPWADLQMISLLGENLTSLQDRRQPREYKRSGRDISPEEIRQQEEQLQRVGVEGMEYLIAEAREAIGRATDVEEVSREEGDEERVRELVTAGYINLRQFAEVMEDEQAQPPTTFDKEIAEAYLTHLEEQIHEEQARTEGSLFPSH